MGLTWVEALQLGHHEPGLHEGELRLPGAHAVTGRGGRGGHPLQGGEVWVGVRSPQ